jgi:hypothetical protein
MVVRLDTVNRRMNVAERGKHERVTWIIAIRGWVMPSLSAPHTAPQRPYHVVVEALRAEEIAEMSVMCRQHVDW